MSQMPPQQQYGFTPPPPGYPPQPGMGYGQVPPQPKTSGAAIASFVLGLLGCFGITGILAIVFGFVGIANTGKPAVRGRGFAITGLILGLLWLVGIGVLSVAGYAVYAQSAPDRATAQQFMADLSAGQVAQAQSLCQPSVTPASIQAASDQVRPLGNPVVTKFFGLNYSAGNAGSNTVVSGVAKYAGGTTKQITFTFTPAPTGGKNLIQDFKIQ